MRLLHTTRRQITRGERKKITFKYLDRKLFFPTDPWLNLGKVLEKNGVAPMCKGRLLIGFRIKTPNKNDKRTSAFEW